jgi:hypothetical protein
MEFVAWWLRVAIKVTKKITNSIGYHLMIRLPLTFLSKLL